MCLLVKLRLIIIIKYLRILNLEFLENKTGEKQIKQEGTKNFRYLSKTPNAL